MTNLSESQRNQIKNQKLTVAIIIAVLYLFAGGLFIGSSVFIPIIKEEKSYVPKLIDYIRVAILASICSSIVILSSSISRFGSLSKLWLEFLAILLIAYPQKTEQFMTHSRWNLVKREAYLFGVFFNANTLAYLLYHSFFRDLIYPPIQEQDNEDLASNNIHEIVSRQATLSNCLKIRRESHNLHKIFQSEYVPEDDTVKVIIDYNNDSIEIANPHHNRRSSSTQLLAESQPSYSSTLISTPSLVAVNSSSTALSAIKSKDDTKSMILPVLFIMISTWLYEIGISLIISITFIYIPELDDSLFTRLERVYYNNIERFLVEVITPLFVISTGTDYYISQTEDVMPRLRIIVLTLLDIAIFIAGLWMT